MTMMLTSSKTNSPAIDELLWLSAHAQTQPLRSMQRFAEDELVLPTGRFEGQRFKASRQPYAALVFQAIAWAASVGIYRYFATGPTQSGKTLLWFVLVCLYYLFEVGETIVIGLPTMDIARDKWADDLLPAIERTRYREYLPRRGGGSKGGGNIARLDFGNGATIRFMSGGGRDHSRAHFTARIIVLTEINSMDTIGSTSKESDKVSQIEGRSLAYGDQRRIYGECTQTDNRGRIHQEYLRGTQTRIALPCPHCRHYVVPEREHLLGWQDAPDIHTARRQAALACPDCGVVWSTDQWRDANHRGRLVHGDQVIAPDGQVHGDPPQTDTLSFRWSCVHNLFTDPGLVGAEEWAALRATDEESAQRKLAQQYWAVPHEPETIDVADVQLDDLMRRVEAPGRGFVPDDVVCMAMGVDCRHIELHYLLKAWFALPGGGFGGHIVDYGTYPVDQTIDRDLAIERAIVSFGRDIVEAGWPLATGDRRRLPEQVWIDARWKTDAVCRAIRILENGGDGRGAARFRASMGFGVSQDEAEAYRHPDKVDGDRVLQIGEQYCVRYDRVRHLCRVSVNADHWKTRQHEQLTGPLRDPAGRRLPGKCALYDARPIDHHTLARHFTAEEQRAEFIAGRGDKPGKGNVVRWFKLRAANHYLDAGYLADAAGHLCNPAIFTAVPGSPTPAAAGDADVRGRKPSGLVTPDGRPYLVTQRSED